MSIKIDRDYLAFLGMHDACFGAVKMLLDAAISNPAMKANEIVAAKKALLNVILFPSQSLPEYVGVEHEKKIYLMKKDGG